MTPWNAPQPLDKQIACSSALNLLSQDRARERLNITNLCLRITSYAMSLQIPHRDKANGASTYKTKAVILVSYSCHLSRVLELTFGRLVVHQGADIHNDTYERLY